MKKELLAGICIAIIAIIGGYLGLQNPSSQGDLAELSDSTNLQSCEDFRKNHCLTSNQITESDYPAGCFQNGENILENPYQCPS